MQQLTNHSADTNFLTYNPVLSPTRYEVKEQASFSHPTLHILLLSVGNHKHLEDVTSSWPSYDRVVYSFDAFEASRRQPGSKEYITGNCRPALPCQAHIKQQHRREERKETNLIQKKKMQTHKLKIRTHTQARSAA